MGKYFKEIDGKWGIRSACAIFETWGKVNIVSTQRATARVMCEMKQDLEHLGIHKP